MGKLISQTGSENASPAATSFVELETAAGVSEHSPLSAVRTLFKTTYDAVYATIASLSDYVTKALYDAHTILYATTDNTPAALTVSEQTVVGRATGGNISALAIDSDLSSVSGNHDTLPSAKATKTALDAKAPFQPTGATYSPSSGAQNVALDVTSNNMHIVNGHASGTAITFTITGAANNQPFVVSILQGGTTVSTIAGWFATIRWAGGTPPVLTATLNKRDTFGFIRTGTDTYDGFVIGQNC